MLDFVAIKTTLSRKNDSITVYPEFVVKRSKDLMIRGKAFYAIWDEARHLWSRNEGDVQRLVDQMVYDYVEEHYPDQNGVDLKLLCNFSSNKWTEWQKYCKSLPDNYHELDANVIFANHPLRKEDYASHILPYPLSYSETPAWDELIGTLYEPEERAKIEWTIGAIISGDSKRLQKFLVFYGAPGSGKSTILNIINSLFQGYSATFESRALASSNNSFALEAFRSNPLVAIQHDGDLSRIEDNTKLNSIVAHESMVVNEKFKSTYEARFNTFLIMGTNKPVRITDAKSGIIRRLIDVNPSGQTIPRDRYDILLEKIKFELGGIAGHCLKLYQDMGRKYYDKYVAVNMIGATNDMYNFIEENYEYFLENSEEGVSLTVAWKRYKEYCEDAQVMYPMSRRAFKDELKNYFKDFYERYQGKRSVYYGFLKDKFFGGQEEEKEPEPVENETWMDFQYQESLFDKQFSECPAQYANTYEKPKKAWAEITTKLKDLDTSKIHYIRIPENVIVIDFDLKDENGKKSFQRNLEAASKWPKTYAELSKSGAGIHLHYIYDGDPTELSRIYGDDIEIKVFTGFSSLRRKLTKCVNIEIATISSGLPLKGVKNVVSKDVIKSERVLRAMIQKNLLKQYHGHTKPSMDFIYKLLNDAYQQGLHYDVRDMRPDIQQFAMGSTNQADYCMRLVSKMPFCSEETSKDIPMDHEKPIVFFDCEVFPNLFIICWTKQKSGIIAQMINPTPEDVERLTEYRLVGFNNRKYDNHILYARMMGYNEEQLYRLSKRIISGDRDAFFGEAYNLSYTDIYDLLSAQNKMGLKKWEIKLGITHREFPYPWDRPVPKDKWVEAADYCCNDVFATEAVWDANQEDWTAREILAEWSGLTVNDTTNNHTTKLIVGDDRNPQSKFIYTDLSTIFPGYEYDARGIDLSRYNEGTKIVRGKSIYMGEDPGEGGYAWALPGMYSNVALLDVESMHPHSAIRLKIFGEEYTARYQNIVDLRLAIKHKKFDVAKKLAPPRLHRYLDDKKGAKKLANALKTAINAVYGLTSASFPNRLRDPRNVDNIVAKYGALFMITLKHKVQEMGYTVVHIKTDSIKIADADERIIQFVCDFGKEYGYNFDHEATYSKMCIVNDAVYVARYAEPQLDENGNEYWWTATGTQFQVPYVFKTLFSHEPVAFQDLCETKSVTTALYLDMNERLPEGEHNYHFVGRVGLFCPMLPGSGGGVLLRQKDTEGEYSAATGTKTKEREEGIYRWMESDMVKELGLEDKIDMTYYKCLADDAVEAISKYGDFEWFVSEDAVQWSVDDDISMAKNELYPFEQYVNKPIAA